MYIDFSSKIPLPDSIAVGRDISLFAEDIDEQFERLYSEINKKRILVIGGAGSIGSNTIETVSLFAPAALHVVDQNENGLAELVRRLRSRRQGLNVNDFKTLPLNYGNMAFFHFLASNGPYDAILNFAALKHVRSEKDTYSLMEMLNTNLLLMANLFETLSTYKTMASTPSRFFSVSTDKAANPSSMMGASKRLMEHFLFDKNLIRPNSMLITSARFANVAYSNGSLLQSFNNRIQLNQPLVSPKDCKRYFVSLEESGHICTLSAFLAPKDTIVIPKLDPEKHLILLEDVLYGFLDHHGYTPQIFENENEARQSVVACKKERKWPVILTALDTVGEKPYEEFLGEGEFAMDISLNELSGIKYVPSKHVNIMELKSELEQLISNFSEKSPDKDVFKQLIASVEPMFLHTHKESSNNLDQRM